MTRSVTVGLLAVGGILWLAFTGWTLRRVWRTADTPFGRMVYGLGVRGLGLTTWAVWTVLMTLWNTSNIPVRWRASAAAFIGLPLWLWAGYFWGREMARFFGRSPPA